MKLMKPVAAKDHLQPKCMSSKPMRGIPIADENFAAPSVIAIGKLLSLGGNQAPIALAFAGKIGDSAMPSRKRAPNSAEMPVETAAANVAQLHRNVPALPTCLMPKRSNSIPAGNCIAP